MTTITATGTIYIRSDDNDNIQWSNNDSTWTTISEFPIMVNNSGSDLTVELRSNIKFTSINHYFVFDTSNITFNGNFRYIIIDNVATYPGAFRNNSLGVVNINIKKIFVQTVNSEMLGPNGWICQGSFQNGTIEHCFTNGPINSVGGEGAGGIIGSYANNCTVTNCYTVGNIAQHSGGIFGASSSNCTAINCYSLGNIGEDAGGIFGRFSNNCSANNCYSAGHVTNLDGIFGYGADEESSQTDCYVANGSWDDADAIASLSGIGTVWTNTQTPNIPFLLLAFNDNFYNNIISISIRVGRTTSLDITRNETKFQIIDDTAGITINTSTGQLTLNSNGTYSFKVMIYEVAESSSDFIIFYNIIDFSISTTKGGGWVKIRNKDKIIHAFFRSPLNSE